MRQFKLLVVFYPISVFLGTHQPLGHAIIKRREPEAHPHASGVAALRARMLHSFPKKYSENDGQPLALCVLSLYAVDMWTEHGVQILRECEAQIRGIVAEAAAEGAYKAVVQLAKLAKNISAVAVGIGGAGAGNAVQNADECVPETLPTSSSQATSASVEESLREPESRQVGQPRRKSKHLRSTYPRFLRVKDDLVKIGWSKKEKREYRHKAPRFVVDCLRDRILSVGGRGKLAATDDLFPLDNANDGTEIPTYQSYLCLAWFRKERLIRQEGRQGYRVRDPQSFTEELEKCWKNLSSDT
jgi:hypothetical protein